MPYDAISFASPVSRRNNFHTPRFLLLQFLMVKIKEILSLHRPVVPQKEVAVVVEKRKKRKRTKKKNSKNKKLQKMSKAVANGSAFEVAYLKTINDPFEYPGVHLGFGCMVPTVLSFAYARGSFAANADGSFIVGAQPAIGTSGNFTGGSNSGATSAVTYGYGVCSNATNLGIFSYARVISGGLRVRVGQAMTAAPGVMVGFSASTGASATLSSTNTPTQCLNLPQAQMAWGNETVQVTWRPRDANDFDFQLIGNTPVSSGELYVAGTGFPASVTVFYEAVFHLEVFTTFTSGIVDPGNASSSYTPGFDTLQNLAKTLYESGPQIISTAQEVFGLNSKFGRSHPSVYSGGGQTLETLNYL